MHLNEAQTFALASSFALGLLALSQATAPAGATEAPAAQQDQAGQQGLSKLFDFSNYKHAFQSHYAGLQELVRRGYSSLTLTSAAPATPEIPAMHEKPSSKLKLPKLFDFDHYKRLFEKHYSSLAEEVVRKKYFLARAIRAIVSAVK